MTASQSASMANQIEIGPIDRLVLLGGGALLVRLAEWAKASNLSVTVVTSPRHATEKPSGTGSLTEQLKAQDIPVMVTESVDSPDVEAFIGSGTKDFCLSLGAAWIFKTKTIETLFGSGLYNLHGTRLPQDRGGGGFSWQILMGNRLGYCQLHNVDGGVDTGDIVQTEEFIYPPSCRTPADYSEHYVERSFALVTKLLSELRAGSVTLARTTQPHYLSTYWPRLHTDTHGWVDWRWETADLERFICAFDDPYGGAQTYLGDKEVRLKSAMASYHERPFHPFQAGIVFHRTPTWACVATAGGSLVVERVLDSNGKNILGELRNGDIFSTPSEKLDAARARVAYDASGLVT